MTPTLSPAARRRLLRNVLAFFITLVAACVAAGLIGGTMAVVLVLRLVFGIGALCSGVWMFFLLARQMIRNGRPPHPFFYGGYAIILGCLGGVAVLGALMLLQVAQQFSWTAP
ncbi:MULTISPECIES: hypothetical protein [Nitrospirillum]|uniref:Uncharacterized protein n=1 Tax=Nitrospirillum amazonense TaxID=28077 RepID=A0A560G145_9PROT|nr:hypothetical protein [Nitrospirillum amazonense]MEC4589572.1 hypothetical protein [Nitrospirillum amazonense]TWB27615.1 hypothetical protein FBZ88_10674 [Nitrospirillum amazonense]